MDNNQPALHDEVKSKRGRLMGKLFGKDKKSAASGADVDAFLQRSDMPYSSPPSSATASPFSGPPPPYLPSASPPLSVPPPAGPPRLAKLDTAAVSRFAGGAVNSQQQQQQQQQQVPASQSAPPVRGPPLSPRRNRKISKKGLVVRFVDTYPDVIGEGGDESETPTMEISRRKKAAAPPPPPPPPPPSPRPARKPLPPSAASYGSNSVNDGKPGSSGSDRPSPPPKRTPTGSSLAPDSGGGLPQYQPPPQYQAPPPPTSTLLPGTPVSSRFLDSPREKDDNRKSYIEIHSAQMREAEGQAFAKAARTVSAAANPDWDDGRNVHLARASPPDRSPDRPEPADYIGSTRPAGAVDDISPTSAYSTGSGSQAGGGGGAGSPSKGSIRSRGESAAASPMVAPPAPLSYQPSVYRSTDAGPLIEAYQIFIGRTRHLWELFRLHAETVRPLGSSSLDQLARAGLWWFVRGRAGLEATLRGPAAPAAPAAAMVQTDMEKQQAYANLAKAYWLAELVIPEVAEARNLVPDPDVAEATNALVSGLKKLAFSMRRNQLLPPEEPFLPQAIDKSVWVEYPSISADLVSLLTGRSDPADSHLAAGQQQQKQRPRPPASIDMIDAYPLGDTQDSFCFGRVHADVFLREQDGGGPADSPHQHQLRFPCLLSMVRPANRPNLAFVLASQNGDVQLRIQEGKSSVGGGGGGGSGGSSSSGPVLDDIRWRNDESTLELRLRRGYMLAMRCSKPDYRTLWSMYDFGRRVQAMLAPHPDEMVVFRSTLVSFQYLDQDPSARMFPREPVPQCDVALFEKILKEASAGAVRQHHRGFRLAVVTGPRTRSMSGVNHTYSPAGPIQFSFVRSDGGAPALQLRFANGRQKGVMVLTFNEPTERLRFHTLLIGTALHHDEKLVVDVPVTAFVVSQSLADPDGLPALSRVPWRSAKIVNEETVPPEPAPTVNADRLRIVLDYKDGILTDRVNAAPGELRIRLEVANALALRVHRQPQQDMTASVFESQVRRDLATSTADALRVLAESPTIRTFTFETLAHLHEFQFGLTGFKVLFDGVSAAFAIARRRMVVPIYKKWEAGPARIQVVRQESKVLQMLVFFDGFSHARCMNLALKGTDVYEALHRGSKAGVKLVDAKFPLPGPSGEGGLSGDATIPDEFAFVCLDLPDLPGEHDDISILFEDERDRDNLVAVLPAPVKGSARLSRAKS